MSILSFSRILISLNLRFNLEKKDKIKPDNQNLLNMCKTSLLGLQLMENIDSIIKFYDILL